MNAQWQNYCLTTPAGRTLAVVREDKHGWVWHAKNSYTMTGEAWFGLPDMTEKQACAAAETALREDYELYKEVFDAGA